jgi:hypothetical protein
LSHPDLLTDSGVAERPRTDFTGDHLTGIKSHPQLEVDTVAVFDFSGESGGLILNAQGSQTRTDSVVLQRDRRTEHRHDAVAGELVHRSAVAFHHCRAPVGKLCHDLAQSFCPDGCGDIHRMNDIGEENRHLLVLGAGIDEIDWGAAAVTKPGVLQRLSATRPARCCGRHIRPPPIPGPSVCRVD